jgi:hypothetical protein
MIDSLVSLLNSPAGNLKGNDIYFFARAISPPTNMFPNDRTIQQLKSSGNLRLIRGKNISNEIMAYDQIMRETLFELQDEIEIRAEYRQLASKVFKTTVFHEMIAGDTVAKPAGKPVLFTTDPGLVNELIGGIQYFKRVHQTQLTGSRKLLTQAKQLSNFIKKEYHIKGAVS